MDDEPKHSFSERLHSQHGPLMTGSSLWRALGYKSSASFRQAKVRNTVCIRVFNLPGRRGIYAFTKDVAAWLERLENDVL